MQRSFSCPPDVLVSPSRPHTEADRQLANWNSPYVPPPLSPTACKSFCYVVDHVTRNSILSISIRGLACALPMLCSVWHVMQMPWCYAHSQAWPQSRQEQQQQQEQQEQEGQEGQQAQSGLATIGLKFNFWLDFNVRGETWRVDCEIRWPSQFQTAPPYLPLTPPESPSVRRNWCWACKFASIFKQIFSNIFCWFFF